MKVNLSNKIAELNKIKFSIIDDIVKEIDRGNYTLFKFLKNNKYAEDGIVSRGYRNIFVGFNSKEIEYHGDVITGIDIFTGELVAFDIQDCIELESFITIDDLKLYKELI